MVRFDRQVRFGHLLAAERGAAEHSAAALRRSAAELAAANGAPALLGDVEFGGEEAPRIRRTTRTGNLLVGNLLGDFEFHMETFLCENLKVMDC